MNETNVPARTHKLMDRNPFLGSVLITLILYILASIASSLLGLLGLFIPVSLVSIISAVVTVLLAALIYRLWFRPETEGMLRGGEPGAGLRYILLIAVYAVVSSLLGFAVMREKPFFHAPTLAIVAAAVMAGFLEELLFRGLFLTSMMRKSTGRDRIVTALLVSSVVFGLMHGTNILSGANVGSSILQVFGTFFVGIALGALYLRTGSLWPCMIVHTLFDIFAICTSNTIEETGTITGGINAASWVDLALCTVMGVCALILFLKKDEIENTIRVWKKKWTVN